MLQSEAVVFAYGAIFLVLRRLATGFGKKEAEENVGGTSQTKKNDRAKKKDKPEKEEKKDEASTAGSTNSAHAPDPKITATSIPQDLVIVRSFTSFGRLD